MPDTHRRRLLSPLAAAASAAAAGVTLALSLPAPSSAGPTSSTGTITLSPTAPDQTTTSAAGTACPGFTSATRLIGSPVAMRLTAASKPAYALLVRFNRDPLSCQTHTRGIYSIQMKQFGDGDGQPELLGTRAHASSTHRYCFNGRIATGDESLGSLAALNRIHTGGKIRVALRPYTRRDDGSTGLLQHAITRTVPLKAVSADSLHAASYARLAKHLGCT